MQACELASITVYINKEMSLQIYCLRIFSTYAETYRQKNDKARITLTYHVCSKSHITIILVILRTDIFYGMQCHRK